MEKDFSMKVFSFNEMNEADMNSIRGGISTRGCEHYECGTFAYCGLYDCNVFICRINKPIEPCKQQGDGTTS